ncbi:hypothetical protein CRG98_017945 [Punica granatum]|uniref:Cation-transporting P-type ATPase N-terminal domain-containing protein n=1 Tax=Punica granatum TaxID=22663 RepID=A0A2I0JZH1_PUNGR|nr:hypothetical protein CRG98_017945 [Punica granatum]
MSPEYVDDYRGVVLSRELSRSSSYSPMNYSLDQKLILFKNCMHVSVISTVDNIVNAVVGIVVAAVTIIVVAIPEGLPLAVTLTLDYSTRRMISDQTMVRKLSAVETMGSATTICMDKTGTLTLNQMKVTKFRVGEEFVTNTRYSIFEGKLDLIREGVALNTTGSVFRVSSGSNF